MKSLAKRYTGRVYYLFASGLCDVLEAPIPAETAKTSAMGVRRLLSDNVDSRSNPLC
jgi:hypothetical protein